MINSEAKKIHNLDNAVIIESHSRANKPVNLQTWIIGLLVAVMLCAACSGQVESQPTAAQTNTKPPRTTSAIAPTVTINQLSIAEEKLPLPVLSVTASVQTAENPAQNAVDGNPDTIWNSGANAPGWIEVDLGLAYQIQVLSIKPEALPAARFLKIETTESPSWVAWREIQVFGSPAKVVHSPPRNCWL